MLMEVNLEALAEAVKDIIRGMKGRPNRKQQQQQPPDDTEVRAVLKGMLSEFIMDMVVQVEVEELVKTHLPHGSRPETACIAGMRAMQRLGSGAYGTVFDVGKGRVAKLIQLFQPRGRNRSAREVFDSEVDMMKRAARLGVGPPLHDSYACCSKFGVCYGIIVMDRVKGVTLREWLNSQNHTPAQIEKVRAALLSAIEKLHKGGVYHNDLHPGNVIVVNNKDVRIIDYGMARDNGARRPNNKGRQHRDFAVLSDMRARRSTVIGRRPDDTVLVLSVVDELLRKGLVKPL